MFNRGQRPSTLPSSVKHLVGDRNDKNFESFFAEKPFDVVIDMICFNAQQAEQDVRAFSARCEHFIFCSTVCVYGVSIPPRVLIDETFEPAPISEYGKNKLAAEQCFGMRMRAGQFNMTIIRPSQHLRPRRIAHRQPRLRPARVGPRRARPARAVQRRRIGLVEQHASRRLGKLFAYAALNAKTFGKSYNATTTRVYLARLLIATAAAAMGKTRNVIFMPADGSSRTMRRSASGCCVRSRSFTARTTRAGRETMCRSFAARSTLSTAPPRRSPT